MDHIEREPLLKIAKSLQGNMFSTPLIIRAIEEAPINSAKYEWMKTHYKCSKCQQKYYDSKTRKYCSECGAKFLEE